MLPLAPVTFPAAFPAVRPSGMGGGRADSDEAAVLARLERDLELQRATIRRAMADIAPIGQKTVRGTLTNEMMHDADEPGPSEDEESEMEEEAEFE